MNATVTLALSELDILRAEPTKVKEEMEKKIEELRKQIYDKQGEILEQINLRKEAEDKTKGITITVKERIVDPNGSGHMYYWPYMSYAPEYVNKEISSVTYSNMDEVLETIKESLDKEQKEQLKDALAKIGAHKEELKKLEDAHAKEIRILKDELDNSDKDERIAKLEAQIRNLTGRNIVKRILNISK